MKTPLGNLLRRFADMVDNGDCGVTAEEFAKVADQHMRDHKRVELLSQAVTILLEEQNAKKRIEKNPCEIIDINDGKRK